MPEQPVTGQAEQIAAISSGQYPLETRTAMISPEELRDSDGLPSLFTALAGRGYNTLALPVLADGSIIANVRKDGTLNHRGVCPLREALAVAEDFPLTVLLYLDLLSAGPEESDRLGNLANDHRQWLMKNAQGKTKIHSFPDRPGLFCWTTIDYRRYLGNMLVELAESQRFDGLLLDLRCIPKSTEKPKTWSHLGFSSLQRIQRELGVNLESFLNQPTVETLRAIELWRFEQLLRFIENIKARIHEVRQPVLTAFLGLSRLKEAPFVPWIDAYNHGLLEELYLDAKPETINSEVDYIDILLSESRPWIAVVNEESELGRFSMVMQDKAALGFMVMRPDTDAEESLEPAELTWDTPGAVEVVPVAACRGIVRDLLKHFKETKRLYDFFYKLDSYFESSGERIKAEEAVRIRKDLQRISRKLRDSELDVKFDRQLVIQRLNLMMRILQMAPFQSVEF